MQITIDLPPDLEKELIDQASRSNIPLQTLILQTLRQKTYTLPTINSQWSQEILAYEANPDFPAFESYREELLPPHEMELF